MISAAYKYLKIKAPCKTVRALRVIKKAFALLLLIIGACEAPLRPGQPSGWFEAAVFPEKADILAVAESATGAAYAVGKTPGPEWNDMAVIFKYQEGVLTEEFTGGPNSDTILYCINSGPGGLWAGGSKDGRAWGVRLVNGKWEEYAPPPAWGVNRIVAAHPVGNDTCWFEGEKGPTGLFKILFIYDKGVWRKAYEGLFRRYMPVLCVTHNGLAFKYYETAGADVMLISADGGLSWQRETIPTRYGPRGEFLADFTESNIAAGGNDVFLTVDLEDSRSGIHLTGLVRRRDAVPGAGDYKLVFYSPRRGEVSGNVRLLAFRDAENGRAVGVWTSLVLRNGVWVEENVLERWRPQFEAIAAGRLSYWAVVSDSDVHAHTYVLYEAR